jgi:hypothetical protein
LSVRHRVSSDTFDLRGKFSRQRPHGEGRNAFRQPEQRHVVPDAAIPFRVIDQLFDRVLGVANANVEAATGSRAAATALAVVTTHCAPISAQSLCVAWAPTAQRRVSARGPD